MTHETYSEAANLVLQEGRLLDEKKWDDWLGLYAEDAVIWMPTWRNETELTNNPDTELSFIYLDGKPALQERISRITSGLSVSSMPQPRTCHLITGVIAQAESSGVIVRSSWASHIYNPKDKSCVTCFGLYRHTLVQAENGYRIHRKDIVLMNDYISSKLDIYYV